VIYEYKCSACGARFEKIQSSSEVRNETLPCAYCSEEARIQVSLPSIARATMTNKPLDIAVGHDSEVRWSEIHRQQDERDKTRRKANQVGLAASGPGQVAPISAGQREVRTEMIRAVGKDGFKPVADNPVMAKS
jgi:putative FmdB family regulatory protein